jgi:hypothetical protein
MSEKKWYEDLTRDELIKAIVHMESIIDTNATTIQTLRHVNMHLRYKLGGKKYE